MCFCSFEWPFEGWNFWRICWISLCHVVHLRWSASKTPLEFNFCSFSLLGKSWDELPQNEWRKINCPSLNTFLIFALPGKITTCPTGKIAPTLGFICHFGIIQSSCSSCSIMNLEPHPKKKESNNLFSLALRHNQPTQPNQPQQGNLQGLHITPTSTTTVMSPVQVGE